MSFIFYDIGMLVLFAIVVSIILYRKRSNIQKEGLSILYRTQWGTNLIEKIGTKYKKTLNVLSYVSISVGWVLMAGMIYMFGKIVWIYLYQQQIVRAIKVPPIMPLVPYIDKVVTGIPPIYFFYFVLILAAIAIPHEFAHGIFMRKNKIKIKSTGFGFFPFFFPVLPLAFVEQEEKSFVKASKFDQMAVLSAGTFANFIFTFIFLGMLVLFFSLAFAPVGVQFDSYSYSLVNKTQITEVNGIVLNDYSIENILGLMEEEGLTVFNVQGFGFVASKEFITSQLSQKNDYLILYHDAPAIRTQLPNIIEEINGKTIKSVKDLSSTLNDFEIGERIILKVYDGVDSHNIDIVLEQNPVYPEKAWMGISFFDKSPKNLVGKLIGIIQFKEDNVYYRPLMGEFSNFIYYLLWWLAVASISVALLNMLPLGGLDGGRFLYLGVWSLTGRENIGKYAYVFATYFFLFLLGVIMFSWARSFF